MDSVPLDMEDLFGEGVEDEDIEQQPQMLPDLPEGEDAGAQGDQNQDETENKKVLDKLKGMKGASKNPVKRSMPKLDSTRLTGERGIPILPRIFKDVKLKGKGHEVEDLRVVMRYLEHWAHRLFPKMPFDEVLDRVERLGTKQDVKTCIKKMRMDMPVLGSDTVSRGGEDEGEEEEDAGADKSANKQSEQAPSAEDLFDALIRDEQEMEAEMGVGGPSNEGVADTSRLGTQGGSSPPPPPSFSSPSSQATSSTNAGLSADVLSRIERNRRLAMEKRAKKLGIAVPNTSQHGSPSVRPSPDSGGGRFEGAQTSTQPHHDTPGTGSHTCNTTDTADRVRDDDTQPASQSQTGLPETGNLPENATADENQDGAPTNNSQPPSEANDDSRSEEGLTELKNADNSVKAQDDNTPCQSQAEDGLPVSGTRSENTYEAGDEAQTLGQPENVDDLSGSSRTPSKSATDSSDGTKDHAQTCGQSPQVTDDQSRETDSRDKENMETDNDETAQPGSQPHGAKESVSEDHIQNVVESDTGAQNDSNTHSSQQSQAAEVSVDGAGERTQGCEESDAGTQEGEESCADSQPGMDESCVTGEPGAHNNAMETDD